MNYEITLKHFGGVDPGTTGAIAIVDGNSAYVWDMVTFNVRVGKVNKNLPDWKSIAKIIAKLSVLNFMVEQSQAMPEQGVSSSFINGGYYHGILGICAAYEMTVKTIRPAIWKRHFGLIKQTKDASRKKAMELYPSMCDQLKLKKNDGRAEAILIAEYNRVTHQ